MERRRGFTLIEVLIALAIFATVMALVLLAVTGMFRSLRQAQVSIEHEQRTRFFLGRLSREISSLTRIIYPQMRFKGEQTGFAFVYAREDALVESRFACDSAAGTLEHYWQEPADYNWETSAGRETGLKNLTACSFSYSDGNAWRDAWDETNPEFPQAVKVSFKFNGDDRQRELVVNIPISQ